MSVLDDTRGLALADPSGMAGHITGMPEQLEAALEIGRGIDLAFGGDGLESIVVLGMGGSAIAGEFAAGFLDDRLRVPFEVVRRYSVPDYVGPDTLAVVSSYSGNTEETLTAYAEAAARGARIVCSTTGGRLAERAAAAGHGIVRIPAGLPPRAAFGYGLVPLLTILGRLGLIDDPSDEIAAATEAAREAVGRLGPGARTEANPAKELAEWLDGRVPVVYGAAPRTAPVAVRWVSQFAENSKVWAHANALPEMNHNEIVGCVGGGPLGREARVVFLRDEEDHPRIARRVDVTSRALADAGVEVRTTDSVGPTRLSRLFSLVMLGDFVSLYLAVLRGIDPTPVAPIDALKKALSEAGPRDPD
jgi:glucose/mannose-6-phosphate isomerase